MSVDATPRDLPYKTASEYVAEIAPKIRTPTGEPLSPASKAEAYRLADRYGIDEQLDYMPPSIAVGAIYVGAMLNNQRVTQKHLADISGRNVQGISIWWRAVAHAEEVPGVDPPRKYPEWWKE